MVGWENLQPARAVAFLTSGDASIPEAVSEAKVLHILVSGLVSGYLAAVYGARIGAVGPGREQNQSPCSRGTPLASNSSRGADAGNLASGRNGRFRDL